ncbi:D1 chromosomal protein isoform X2 [Megalopta genalis]|uniref:D1 chromosomal protein isoform X2 n=1 Tax=Megalopta genalis TaxID=115081 RepID=UPI0014436F4E|nr:high mobility group protein I-like isoform X2 [Megalopta genalis]
MSDENSSMVEEQKKKRGRPSKTDKNAVKEPKKRGRPALDKNNAMRAAKSDNEDDASPTPVKKARGRPKGSHKKKGSPKVPSGRGRGRPKKKEEKPESTGEEEDEQEEEEEEEEEN